MAEQRLKPPKQAKGMAIRRAALERLGERLQGNGGKPRDFRGQPTGIAAQGGRPGGQKLRGRGSGRDDDHDYRA